MSCSADYYLVFWSGSADYYVVWNVPQTKTMYTRSCYALRSWHTLPYVSSVDIGHYKVHIPRVPQCLSPLLELCPHSPPLLPQTSVPPTPCIIKNARKYFFCKHWQHLLVGAEVRVASTSMCWNNLSCYNIMQRRLGGATNIGSADYSALTMRYSRNSRRWRVFST